MGFELKNIMLGSHFADVEVTSFTWVSNSAGAKVTYFTLRPNYAVVNVLYFMWRSNTAGVESDVFYEGSLILPMYK